MISKKRGKTIRGNFRRARRRPEFLEVKREEERAFSIKIILRNTGMSARSLSIELKLEIP